MLGWLRGSKRNRAIRALKLRLAAAEYDVNYPPDTFSQEYEVGAEIWVPMPEGISGDELISHRDKVRATSEKIAKQFGLTAVGRGPIALGNTLYFVCYGFRRTPLS